MSHSYKHPLSLNENQFETNLKFGLYFKSNSYLSCCCSKRPSILHYMGDKFVPPEDEPLKAKELAKICIMTIVFVSNNSAVRFVPA